MGYDEANREKGEQGEQRVREELHCLDESYTALHNLVLDPDLGDIDHVVVAPHGIYALETKNWNADIEIDQESAYYDGYETDKSPSKQVKKNSETVKSTLEKNGIRVPFVKPIIVFVDSRVDIEKVPSGDVYVTTPQYLKDDLESRFDMYELSKEERTAVIEAIRDDS